MPRNVSQEVKSLYSWLLPWVAGAMVTACVLALASLYFATYIVKLFDIAIISFALFGYIIKLFREGKLPFQ
jgi:hypothetical protein